MFRVVEIIKGRADGVFQQMHGFLVMSANSIVTHCFGQLSSFNEGVRHRTLGSTEDGGETDYACFVVLSTAEYGVCNLCNRDKLN